MKHSTCWARAAVAGAAAIAIAVPAFAQSSQTPAPAGTASSRAPSPTVPAAAQPMSDAARDWLAFTDALGKAGQRIHDTADTARTPQQQAELNQALMWAVGAAVLSFSRLDPDYPDWIPMINGSMLGLNGNMDNVYQITRIRGSGSYKIEGDRGRLKNLFLELSNGWPGYTKTSSHIGIYDLNDMKLEPDGRIEVLMSPQRPAGYAGNWIALDPKAEDTFLSLRLVSYDWKTDRDSNLSIQRIDKPIAMPRRDAASTSERLGTVPRYVENIIGEFLRIQDRQGFLKEGANTLRDGTKAFGSASSVNITQQAYQMGEVLIEGSQALVLEGEIPKSCAYWSVMLMDTATNPLDFMFHKSGINGHGARVDPDGKVRLVISEKDPGVANWIDNQGYAINAIRGRFYKCGNPVWASRVVPIERVGAALYPGTPHVSYEERQAELRERARQVQHRRRW